MPVDAPRPANAFQFINFYLEPEVAATNAATIRANTGNEAAGEFLSDEILNDPLIFPTAEVTSNLVFTADLGEVEETYADEWERVLKA